MNLEPLTRFEWERVILAARLSPTTKLVALALATFGNRVGGNAHPGNKKLALQLGLSERTVERHLEILREIGLLERTFRGSAAGRRCLADVYRLVVADDCHERVEFIASPDTRDGSSTADHPTRVTGDDDDGPQEHPTRATDHPTPVTGTPDSERRSPDTRVAPSCFSNTPVQQEDASSVGDSIAAPAKPDDQDAAGDVEYDDARRRLALLAPGQFQQLLDEVNREVGDTVASRDLVVLAAQRVAS